MVAPVTVCEDVDLAEECEDFAVMSEWLELSLAAGLVETGAFLYGVACPEEAEGRLCAEASDCLSAAVCDALAGFA